jgi:hypothetical protein
VAGQRLQDTYDRLKGSDQTFHVVKDSSQEPSSGELTYKGQPGHLYVNLKGSGNAAGELTDIQKLAHEFKHGEQFLDGKMGFIQDAKRNWLGYKDDLVDEAEAFIAGFEAQPLDPAQASGSFLQSVNHAMQFGQTAVLEALSRSGPYTRYPSYQLTITQSELKDPGIYAVPKDKKQ